MQEDEEDRLKPLDGLTAQLVEKQSLEEFAKNAYPLLDAEPEDYKQSNNESDGEDGEDNDENEDKDCLEELRYPNITQASKFLHRGVPFQTLVFELRLLVLPAPIREVIGFTPKCSIYISSVNDMSFMNKAKTFIEDYTAFEWDWWPLMPRIPNFPPGRSRLQQKVSNSSATNTVLCNILSNYSSADSIFTKRYHRKRPNVYSRSWDQSATTHRNVSVVRQKHIGSIGPLFYRICQSIANTLNQIVLSSSLATQKSPSEAQQLYTLAAATASASSIPAHGLTQTRPSIAPGSNNGSVTEARGSGSSTIPTSPQGDVLQVVFGIKDMHEFHEIENIEVSGLLNDSLFFKELKTRYKKYRWFFLRWFSPFRFRHCNFVQASIMFDI